MRSHNTNILVTQAHVCQNSKQVKVLKFNVSEQSVVCTQAVNVLVWSCLSVSHCALGNHALPLLAFTVNSPLLPGLEINS